MGGNGKDPHAHGGAAELFWSWRLASSALRLEGPDRDDGQQIAAETVPMPMPGHRRGASICPGMFRPGDKSLPLQGCCSVSLTSAIGRCRKAMAAAAKLPCIECSSRLISWDLPAGTAVPHYYCSSALAHYTHAAPTYTSTSTSRLLVLILRSTVGFYDSRSSRQLDRRTSLAS
jgi:hypothetical protein